MSRLQQYLISLSLILFVCYPSEQRLGSYGGIDYSHRFVTKCDRQSRTCTDVLDLPDLSKFQESPLINETIEEITSMIKNQRNLIINLETDVNNKATRLGETRRAIESAKLELMKEIQENQNISQQIARYDALIRNLEAELEKGVPCDLCDHCKSQPCQNNATCNEVNGTYQCVCLDGFDGRNCEINIDECGSSPCQNGATCVDGINNYTCSCAPGFEGRNCEIDIDECRSSPCQNGATCANGINNYTCTCVPGFEGRNCEIDIDECKSLPCVNGATCVNGINNFTCTCAPGFEGRYCEINIDECKSSPCKNGATCIDGINKYFCKCRSGFEGLNCETIVNMCKSLPCLNGGTCVVDESGRSMCLCPEKYTGSQCEIYFPNEE